MARMSGRKRRCIAFVEAFVTFSQGFRDSARDSFAGLLGDGLCEPVGLRMLYIQARVSFFL